MAYPGPKAGPDQLSFSFEKHDIYGGETLFQMGRSDGSIYGGCWWKLYKWQMACGGKWWQENGPYQRLAARIMQEISSGESDDQGTQEGKKGARL